jgi:hypothetical protein
MRYRLGRMLQLIGLVVLPVAIAGNAAEKLSLGQSLVISAAGMIVFSLGWLLQQGSGPG